MAEAYGARGEVLRDEDGHVGRAQTRYDHVCSTRWLGVLPLDANS